MNKRDEGNNNITTLKQTNYYVNSQCQPNSVCNEFTAVNIDSSKILKSHTEYRSQQRHDEHTVDTIPSSSYANKPRRMKSNIIKSYETHNEVEDEEEDSY